MNKPAHIPSVIQPTDGQTLAIIGTEAKIMLRSAQTGGAFYTFLGTLPVGAGVPAHIHEHEDEVAHIIDGELEVFLDGKTHKATAGTVLYFPRHIPHGFANVGSTPARAFFVVSPGENFERFIAELSALPANQPPDLAKVGEIFARYGLTMVAKPE